MIFFFNWIFLTVRLAVCRHRHHAQCQLSRQAVFPSLVALHAFLKGNIFSRIPDPSGLRRPNDPMARPDKQIHSARRSELSNVPPLSAARVRILQRATAVTVVKIAKVDAAATGVSPRVFSVRQTPQGERAFASPL